MSDYSYVALNARGLESRGTLNVPDQSEALRRIKEMGLFPLKVLAARKEMSFAAESASPPTRLRRMLGISVPGLGGRIKPKHLVVFTRGVATLIEAGMPLLKGLRLIEEQEENQQMKRAISELASTIESGGTFAEALSQHPKVFNRLYVNMVMAGEIGGSLDVVLKRLAEFLEKAEKIKGKVKAALFYPIAVLFVAVMVVAVLLVFVIPRFKMVFDGMNGMVMPAFTVFVFGFSQAIQHHILVILAGVVAAMTLFRISLRTQSGRRMFDHFKLSMPALGPVFRKVAISRFARTFGTLISSGVPILQTLTILKETTGNVLIGNLISIVHQRVKEGEAIAPALKTSSIFPAMIAGMVDIGEQTGTLPEMLTKIADSCDEEVDNATSAMTSLLEPVMLIFLALVVGSIVIAMFLPLVDILNSRS